MVLDLALEIEGREWVRGIAFSLLIFIERYCLLDSMFYEFSRSVLIAPFMRQATLSAQFYKCGNRGGENRRKFQGPAINVCLPTNFVCLSVPIPGTSYSAYCLPCFWMLVGAMCPKNSQKPVEK